jgi:hypothetical protein
VAICLFDAIVALNVSKVKKNEYFCIFLSLPSFCRCFAEFYETLFSGPRRVVRRDEFYNIGLMCRTMPDGQVPFGPVHMGR